ncbi:MAG: hypothetical protein GXP31_04805, partial [Kiritimatiellaeota bacterium]|nr:hypothetical protein [Kiritimatiellota bacterium]
MGVTARITAEAMTEFAGGRSTFREGLVQLFMTYQSRKFGRFVLVASVIGAAVAGCGRAPPPRPPDTASMQVVNTVPPGLIRYEQSVFPGEVGADATRIALDRAGNLYVAGRPGVRVLDAAGRLVRVWSTSGPAVCIAVGESGRVYVGLAQRLEVYGPNGARITSWGEAGRKTGQFALLSGLAVSEPDVFVADSGNRCIHHFAMNGDFVGDIARRDPAAGEPGLLVPSPYLDCLTAPDGSLVLTDPGRRRVEHRTA